MEALLEEDLEAGGVVLEGQAEEPGYFPVVVGWPSYDRCTTV